MALQHLAVTMGDPAGVGPEICLRLIAAAHQHLVGDAIPVIIGDEQVLERVAYELGLTANLPVFSLEEFEQSHERRDMPCVISCSPVSLENVEPGVFSRDTGLSSFRFVEVAIKLAQAGIVGGVVTAPIHKEAWQLAGVPFPGHTELLGDRTGVEQYCMMLTSDEVTCSFVTSHVGIKDVPRLITTESVFETIELTVDSLRRVHQREPRIVVCGLNPHAGEHGLFGAQEEELAIQPAIEQAAANGWNVVGPLPADTAFIPSMRTVTDGYICMFHDQGLTVLKALAFDRAVNVTLGLPIVRTSVDHGTAMDIAWKGIAEPTSMYEAFRLAQKLSSKQNVASNEMQT